MPNILLVRIDNRLIHGSVVTQWASSYGINLLLVANDELASDEFRQGLMNIATPAHIQARYFTIQHTIDIISKASDSQRIAIICESPQDILKLIEGGVPIKEVNVGNMHFEEGKRQLTKTIAVNDNDVETFRKIRDAKVKLNTRISPNVSSDDNEHILFEENK